MTARAKHGEPRRWLDAVLSGPSREGCIEWPFHRDIKGYGRMRDASSGLPRLATHWVLDLVGAKRPSPDHMALHSCDNPPCCNPRHLRWGTAADNTADMLNRGRSRRPAPKLSPADVREIRQLRGSEPGKSLAARFGVSPQTVCDIQMGRRWRDVS